MSDANDPTWDGQRPLRIGTRGSDLALWQARNVRARLESLGLPAELEIIKTQGDRIDDVPFNKLEGKGFFTKELEDAQLEGRVDLAVHSMKDLSTEQPPGLTLVALIGREDPRELLIANPIAVDAGLEATGALLPLRAGSRVGSSAARRQAQLTEQRPDLAVLELRGNVPTRVEKLRRGDYDAIMLAAAGVKRLELDLQGLLSIPLAPERFVPAPAQGMLAIQCRQEPLLYERLRALHMAEPARSVEAERKLLALLDGGCQLPFGVHIRPEGGSFRLLLFYAPRWTSLAESAGTDAASNPLRMDLTGNDPDALVDQAYAAIKEHA